MRLERYGSVIVGLVVLLAFGGTAASAQQQQGHVDMEGTVAEVPDELPGVYEAHIVAETSVQGGVCACTQTNVDLAVEDEAAADEVVLSPSSWTIDWLRNTAEQPVHGSHWQAVEATIAVDEIPDDQRMVTVTIGGEATADGEWTDFEVNPLELALPAPSDVHQAEDGSAEASSSDEPGDDGDNDADGDGDANADAPADAVTTSAEDVDAEADAGGSNALEAGAGMAGLALAGLAVRRIRA